MDNLQETNKRLANENAELKVMVNELLEVVMEAACWAEDKLLTGDMVDTLGSFANKTPAQSLQDHDRAIAEKVRERCAASAWFAFMDSCTRLKLSHADYSSLSGVSEIRNLSIEELLE